ncbi:MAG: hypothetical protein GY711_04320 [bacterium]|nr:hypothetical protein [bacterium]
MRISNTITIGCALLVVAAAPPAAGQCADLLVGSQTQSGEHFGRSVAADGGRLVVGAQEEDGSSGAAYVFERIGGTWQETARLTGDGGSSRFGNSVAIEGDRIMVGATSERAVYVFEWIAGAWTRVQKVEPLLSQFGFGHEIALQGDLAVISFGGGFLVYWRTGGTWTSVQSLGACSSNLDLDGDRLAMGFWNDCVHVYEREGQGFVLDATLAAPPGSVFFGDTVSLDGDHLAVGAALEPSSHGAVYLYERGPGGWAQTDRIAPNAPLTHNFGRGVVLRGDRLLVGELGSAGTLPDEGSLLVFEKRGGAWTEVRRVFACAPSSDSWFGELLAYDDGTVVMGARDSDTVGLNVGAAHVFDVLAIGTSYCEAVSNSSGSAARTVARGSRFLDANELELRTDQLPPNRNGYYLMSLTQQFLPMLGGGEGNLCLGLPLVRLANDVRNSGAAGQVSLALDLASLPGGTTVMPGDTWNFQFWFHDIGNSSNTSDAVALTFETLGAPSAQFPVTLASLEEDTVQRTFDVTLSQPAAGAVMIPWSTSGSATPMVDYRIESTNPLVVPAGATEVTLLVTFNEDADIEPDETVIVDLLAPTGAVLGTATRLVLTITDDD